MNFLLQLVIGVVVSFISTFLGANQKTPRQEVQELENPTADSSREVAMVFGTVTIESPNVLFYTQSTTSVREVSA